MGNYIKYIVAALLINFGLQSCTEEKISVDNISKGYEYYPLTVGNHWDYVYDSIVYDLSLGIVDTLSGYIREEITEEIDENRFEITRFWKVNLDQNWIETDKWTIYYDDEKLVKVEENIPFIKLVFPPRKSRSWDGNGLFDESIEILVAGESLRPFFNWNYEIVSETEQYINNNINLNNVIQVKQVCDTTIIDLRYSHEKFAPNVGMVEKKLSILDCNCFNIDSSIPWEIKAEKGFILEQYLINYSIN